MAFLRNGLLESGSCLLGHMLQNIFLWFVTEWAFLIGQVQLVPPYLTPFEHFCSNLCLLNTTQECCVFDKLLYIPLIALKSTIWFGGWIHMTSNCLCGEFAKTSSSHLRFWNMLFSDSSQCSVLPVLFILIKETNAGCILFTCLFHVCFQQLDSLETDYCCIQPSPDILRALQGFELD